MGDVGISGKTVFARLDRADQIETQQRQIDQVVGCQFLIVQVGVYQPQSPETAGGRTKGFKPGDKQVVVGSDDNKRDLSPAGKQKSDLPVYPAGKLGKLAGELP
ncbi:MAG: hypothetical protein ACYC6Q_07895 [Syntrophales bacterium]